LNPRDVVPESNMPAFTWLEHAVLTGELTGRKMAALRIVGVPYTDEDIKKAQSLVAGKTELEALIAYLQSLGLILKNKR
jgi:cytochrome c oxidase cbb3-type subunit 2